MKTKIAIKNTEKLEAALAEVQKRCQVRMMTAEKVQLNALRMEEYLKNAGVQKKHLAGCVVTLGLCRYDAFPKAYEYTPSATLVKVEWGKSGAATVTDIRRDDPREKACWYVDATMDDSKEEKDRAAIWLTAEAREDIHKAAITKLLSRII